MSASISNLSLRLEALSKRAGDLKFREHFITHGRRTILLDQEGGHPLKVVFVFKQSGPAVRIEQTGNGSFQLSFSETVDLVRALPQVVSNPLWVSSMVRLPHRQRREFVTNAGSCLALNVWAGPSRGPILLIWPFVEDDESDEREVQVHFEALSLFLGALETAFLYFEKWVDECSEPSVSK